jgi:formate dehydrogenase subunit delta
MENRDMIRMANQIAAFFEAYPHGEALEGIANHIKKFWDPRMRKQIIEYVEGGGEGLSPLVIAALSPKAKAKAKA